MLQAKYIMRFLLTAFLGFFFILVFVSFFILHSVLGYINSSERFVKSVNSPELHDRVLEISAYYIAEEVSKDSTLKPMSADTLRPLIASVITEQWVEEALRNAHGAVLVALQGIGKDAVFDMRKTKIALQQSLQGLKDKMLQDCDSMYGSATCADEKVSGALLDDAERKARLAIDQIPDSIDLLETLGGAEERRFLKANDFQRGMKNSSNLHYGVLGVMVLLFLMIVLLNKSPLARLFFTSGFYLLLSGLVYVLSVFLSGILLERIGSFDSISSENLEMDSFVKNLGQNMIGDAIGGSVMIVFVICGVGAFFILLAQFMPKSRN